MDKNSVVAIPTATGWKGRGVFVNGFPTWTGKELHEMVNRDGYNAVVSTIITGENYGWTMLDSVRPVDSGYVGSARFANIPGYGFAITSVVIEGVPSFAPQARESEWYTDKNVVDSGVAWVYVLGETGIDVYTAYFPLTKVGHVRYDEDTACFGAIEEAVIASCA